MPAAAFGCPAFDEPLKRSDSQFALPAAIGSINEMAAAMITARRDHVPGLAAPEVPPGERKRYSAATVRGRPTNPAGSPKRSIITAVRSLALLVTQAPERTA